MIIKICTKQTDKLLPLIIFMYKMKGHLSVIFVISFVLLIFQVEGCKGWLAVSPGRRAVWCEPLHSALRAAEYRAVVMFTGNVCVWMWEP